MSYQWQCDIEEERWLWKQRLKFEKEVFSLVTITFGKCFFNLDLLIGKFGIIIPYLTGFLWR